MATLIPAVSQSAMNAAWLSKTNSKAYKDMLNKWMRWANNPALSTFNTVRHRIGFGAIRPRPLPRQRHATIRTKKKKVGRPRKHK